MFCFTRSCYHKPFGLLGFWQTFQLKQCSFVQQDGGSRDKLYQFQVFFDISNRNCRGRIGDRKSTGKTSTVLILFLDDYKRGHESLHLSHSPTSLSFINVPVTKIFLWLSSSGSNTEVKKNVKKQMKGLIFRKMINQRKNISSPYSKHICVVRVLSLTTLVNIKSKY